ncbi:response regulator [Methanoregula sp.]|jgi:PAS domain S-box-containing protein|uniref:response regulator n=1 Tax=Methanoregula sp. TaxID=2052170 RepID=UPI0025EF2A72|nr:response regulator [Methanoregula sp.]
MLSVLVIDDEEEVLSVTRLFLERFGNMKVRTAGSTKESLVLLNDQAFDAIIVDYDMPEINGIEFLKILRSKGDLTPVIIFTGAGGEYTAIEALNNGANFYLKKGEDIQPQLREMADMIRRAVEGKTAGRGIGTTQKLLSDAVHFFREPAFAIDRDGKVIAWNDGMAALSGVGAGDMIGKKDYEYAVPFFGRKMPMLMDMVFEDPAIIRQNNYSIIAQEQGTITAWTKSTGTDGGEQILWMKATPLFDGRGIFIGIIGAIRDITHTVGTVLVNPQASKGAGPEKTGVPTGQGKMFDRLLGRSKANYMEGLRLYYREGRYEDAIAAFDRALEIDPSHAFAWHDRAVCLRALERNEEALASVTKALELAPADEEILSTCAETLQKIGILMNDDKILSAAVDAFNRLLEKNPENADAWNNMGICVQEMNRDDLARQYFDRARDLKKFKKDRVRKRNLETIV